VHSAAGHRAAKAQARVQWRARRGAPVRPRFCWRPGLRARRRRPDGTAARYPRSAPRGAHMRRGSGTANSRAASEPPATRALEHRRRGGGAVCGAASELGGNVLLALCAKPELERCAARARWRFVLAGGLQGSFASPCPLRFASIEATVLLFFFALPGVWAQSGRRRAGACFGTVARRTLREGRRWSQSAGLDFLARASGGPCAA
jgi:hypothetical protein